MQFRFHANQSHFRKNGFSLRLALKQRHKGTRKWPILSRSGYNTCTFEFDQGQVTKNQPITVLIWLSESLTICDLQNQFTAGKKNKKIFSARVDPYSEKL